MLICLVCLLAAQLVAIPECNLLLGLSDGEVFCANLDHLEVFGQLSKPREAVSFAVDWQKLRGGTSSGTKLVVGVAVRKRLRVYGYNLGVFTLLQVISNFSQSQTNCLISPSFHFYAKFH